jgi:hypothetical protein
MRSRIPWIGKNLVWDMPVLPRNSSGMAPAAEGMPCGDICSIGNIQEHLIGKWRLEAAKFG